MELASAEVILSIEADAHEYRFTYELPGEPPAIIGRGECCLLASEVAGGFTGVYFALYATGNGRRSQSPLISIGLIIFLASIERA